MQRCSRLLVLVCLPLVVALTHVDATRAQGVVEGGSATPSAHALPPNELGIWGGASIGATDLIGRRTGFDFDEAGLRYGRNLWRGEHASFDWTIDAIPLALISLDRSSDGSGTRHTVYGGGLAPLGLRLAYDDAQWIRPYFAASGGFLYFDERVPADATKFNFTYEFGIGVQLLLTHMDAFTLGYRYHHMSNGGLADRNPGFDSNILYGGFSLFR